MDFFDRIITLEVSQCAGVEINGDIVQGCRLTLHDGTTAEMGLDVDVMWWHLGMMDAY